MLLNFRTDHAKYWRKNPNKKSDSSKILQETHNQYTE